MEIKDKYFRNAYITVKGSMIKVVCDGKTIALEGWDTSCIGAGPKFKTKTF